MKTRARVSEKMKQGVLYIPLNFAEEPANQLLGGPLDPISKIPEMKLVFAKIERV